MKVSTVFAFAALFSIGVCSFAQTEAPKLRKALVKRGQEAVLEQLKDPDSAKFRNLFSGKYDSFLCGEVNAKNSMGGYIGFKRFFAAESAGNYVRFEGDSSFDDGWSNNCRLFDPKNQFK
ncbi:hypothetical protein [Noviherbaspirillum malthae]|uniref:hypothetical protein n=1 Tax=Noviherbaspirillum malthae TaxID=1260987 RepID=UPI00188F6680|nr:hypothetical protein [Noviherbaspirillum malthae]